MSSSGEKGVSTKTLSIIVLVIVAIAASYLAGQFNQNSSIIANADITEDSKNALKAELFNHMKEYYLSKAEHHSEMIEVSNAITDLEKELDSLDSSHSHNEFSSLLTAINNIRSDIVNIKASIRNIDTPTTNTSNFDLEVCQDLNCVDDDSRFNQGDVLYLRGNHNTNDREFEFVIRDSDNDRIDSGQISMTQGNFFWQWSIPNNLADDRYTIFIEIDNDEDEIDFIVS